VCYERSGKTSENILKEEQELKAVVVEKYGEAILKDIPLRALGHEEVRVKVAYCGIGGMDPFIISGEVPLRLPWYMGYQASGIVEEIDKDAIAMGLKVGDRVALDQNLYCGSCYNCRHGRETFCENHNFPYGYPDSLMAEYAILHQRQVFKIPDYISLEEASLTEVVGASLPAIELAPFDVGDSVMVIGGGSCGLLILQLARLRGGTKLTLVEPVKVKRELATKVGADFVIDPKSQDVVAEAMKITENRGFDRVIEASGDSKMIPLCIEMLAQCGRIILFGIYPDHPKLTYDVDKLWFKEAGVQGVFGQSHMFPRAVNILPKLDLKSLLGPVYPLERFQEAFDAHNTMQYAKVLVKC
jgi:(R,R)-butanediol dehydrogenase/meso-butanediol dehydrogenase/diacetyl reductase